MADSPWAWDDPQDVLPASILLYGAPKVGKTHWAVYTLPEPLYVADTENRAALVVRKAVQAGIRVSLKRCESMADIHGSAKAALAEADPAKPGTFIFDTASDLLQMAEDAFLRETNKDKIYPKIVWARVYRKIDKIIEALQRRGFTVVYVCREKETYANDKPTGKVGPEGYKRLPFKSDVILRHTGERLVVEASGLARTKPKELSLEDDWATVYRYLSMEQKE